MKRVFYIECAGAVWRSLADHCRRDAAWQPVLWTAPADDAAAVSRLAPEAVFIAGPDAALGMPGHSAAWPQPALDPALLAALSGAEITALHMMDRMDIASGKGFTHDQRRRHYYGLLRYWLGALEALKPDLIVFSISPHIVFDYVLFALARHLGIATVMFERLGMPGWVFPIESFTLGSDALRSALRERPTAQASELPGDFQKWFVNSTQGQADVPANYQKKLARYGLQGRAAVPPLGRAMVYELRRAVNLWRKYGFGPMRNSYLRSASYPHERAGWTETLLARLRGLVLKRKLMRRYDALCKPLDPEHDYVFLALHYQPERATVPLGGVFGDQTLIVDMLAKTLPADWKLYVKEHPWQLQPFGWGEMQRTQAFYDAIAAHPNVVLVSRDVETSELVSGAKAVATVTGSVGWDAMCKGIPVLLFGAAWYRDGAGVLAIASRASLSDALRRIAGGWKPQLDAVAALCLAFSRICLQGVLEPELEQAEHLAHDDAARAMSAGLVAFVEARYP
ncbi:capsular polysaccharide export protein, LipB/KpsS family [Polaromonas sp. LjRoot131]|uniref:capsular polysaccharide export protein, LipB/KpsS family n=1 Tax=Polaromonas sp. LjRoot131 TaxID=3342262 RepID=UPI003ECE06F1